MSESKRMLTNGTKLLKEGENKRGPYKMFGLLDEYDEVFGTWFNDMSLKRDIDESAGSEVDVEFKVDGDYTTIVSVSAANGSEAGHGAQGDPATATRSSAHETPSLGLPEVAWLAASRMAQADLGFDAAKRLSDRILADLKLKHGLDPDDSIPF